MTIKEEKLVHYFLEIAQVVATRATCRRLKVGAVLTQGDHIISTGYNGSAKNYRHCNHSGGDDLSVDNHCLLAVHAEVNAIGQAARSGVSTEGSVLYITHRPCFRCLPVLINSGVHSVFYKTEYGISDDIEYGITVKYDRQEFTKILLTEQ